jgi:hypothetical protein
MNTFNSSFTTSIGYSKGMAAEYNGPAEFGMLYIGQSAGTYQLMLIKKNSCEQIRQPQAINLADMVSKARFVLGISAAQLANIVGVARPTLYAHLSSSRGTENVKQYESIYQLAMSVESMVAPTIKPIIKSVLVEGKTLREWLSSCFDNHEEFIRLARKGQERVGQGKSKRSVSLSLQKLKLNEAKR